MPDKSVRIFGTLIRILGRAFVWYIQIDERIPTKVSDPADEGILVSGDVGTGISSPVHERVSADHIITVGPWSGDDAIGTHVFTMSYPGWRPATQEFKILADWLLPPPAPAPVRSPFKPRFRTFERVPDLAFTSSLLEGSADPLARYARQYHERWGIPLVKVDSMAQLVTSLASSAAPVQRIRLLCQGDPTGLHLPMFTGKGTTPFCSAALLRAFAQGTRQGFDQILPRLAQLDAAYPLFNSDGRRVETVPLRQYIFRSCLDTNLSTFEPFGLFTERSVPAPLVDRLIERSIELGALTNRLARMRASDAHRPAVEVTLGATKHLIGYLVKDVAASVQVSEDAARALSIIISTFAEVTSLVKVGQVCSRNKQAAYVADLEAAVQAGQTSFTEVLLSARTRVGAAELDVRACRMGKEGLRDAIGNFLGIPPRNVSGFIGRNGYAPAMAVETFADDPQARSALASERPIARALAAWSALYGISGWWDSNRNRSDPAWARLPRSLKLNEWLAAALFLPAQYPKQTPRVLFHRSAGGLPPTDRPVEAIEAFLKSQWAVPPTGAVSRLRDEILAGSPVPIAVAVDYDRRVQVTSKSRKETLVPPDPRFAASVISGAIGG